MNPDSSDWETLSKEFRVKSRYTRVMLRCSWRWCFVNKDTWMERLLCSLIFNCVCWTWCFEINVLGALLHWATSWGSLCNRYYFNQAVELPASTFRHNVRTSNAKASDFAFHLSYFASVLTNICYEKPTSGAVSETFILSRRHIEFFPSKVD